ncbi:MAG: TolC family protein, partial [Cyanobium sp.]
IQVDAARTDVEASRRSLQSAIVKYESGRANDEGTSVVQALSKLQGALDTYRTLVADQNIAIYQLHRYTSAWPSDTENLVRAQYQQWLALPATPSLPADKP